MSEDSDDEDGSSVVSSRSSSSNSSSSSNGSSSSKSSSSSSSDSDSDDDDVGDNVDAASTIVVTVLDAFKNSAYVSGIREGITAAAEKWEITLSNNHNQQFGDYNCYKLNY